MKKTIKKFIFYKIDANDLPINGSNLSLNTRPEYPVGAIHVVINAPSPNSAKQAFPGSMRFFIAIDNKGNPIDNSLISSSYTPEGNYLEVYANGILSLPLGSNQNSGAEPDDPEEVAEIPVYMSEEYRKNGISITQFNKQSPVIKKTCYSYQVISYNTISEVTYMDCDNNFVRKMVNQKETINFCAMDGTPAVMSGDGVLSRTGVC